MAKKGFFEIRARFEGSGAIVDVPKFDGLQALDDNLRRAAAETGQPFPTRGQMPGGFFIKCQSPEEMQALWTALEPKLLESGHRGAIRLHALAGLAFKNDPESYARVMENFEHASPLDPRFDLDAPVIRDEPDCKLS